MDKDWQLIHRIDLSRKGETVYRDKGYFGVKPRASMDKTMHRAVRGRPLLDQREPAEHGVQPNAIPSGTPLRRDGAGVPCRPPHGHHRCQSPGQKHLLLHQFRYQTTAHPPTTTGVAGALEKPKNPEDPGFQEGIGSSVTKGGARGRKDLMRIMG